MQQTETKKYIVITSSFHSDKVQKKFKHGDIVLSTDCHDGHAEQAVKDGFLRAFSQQDAEAMLLKQRGIPLPEVQLPAVEPELEHITEMDDAPEEFEEETAEEETEEIAHPETVEEEQAEEPAPVEETPAPQTEETPEPVTVLDVKQSVTNLTKAVNNCDNIDVLNNTLEAEKKDNNRKTAIEAIELRIAALQNPEA